jgi:hypothetical protein
VVEVKVEVEERFSCGSLTGSEASVEPRAD